MPLSPGPWYRALVVRRILVLVSLASVSACSIPACGGGQPPPPAPPGEPVVLNPPALVPPTPSSTDGDEALPVGVAPPPPDVVPDLARVDPPAGVTGRAIAELSARACRAELRRLAVPHRASTDAAAVGVVAIPVVPTGPVGGVTLEFEGRRALHRVMDCRLLLAIHAWAPVLRAAGVDGLRHLSAFRPGARVRSTGQASGHSRGLAFDPRFFDREGADPLDVLQDWMPRGRGVPPCGPEPEDGQEPAPLPPPAEGQEAGAILRALVCEGIRRELFQVVVTPHHDDAHANHVHLEVVPGVDWTWSG